MKDQATHLLSSENYIIFKWTAIHNKLIKSNCFTIALLLLTPLSTPWKPWKTQNRCRTKRILHTTAHWELTIGYYLGFGFYKLIRNFFYISTALKLKHDLNDFMADSVLIIYYSLLAGPPRLARPPRSRPILHFWFQYALIKKKPVKKFWGRISGLARLNFTVASLLANVIFWLLQYSFEFFKSPLNFCKML